MIEKSEPLSPENKFVQTTLGGLNQSPVTLVEHLWTFNQGAANYLAPGSVIADTFRRYTSTFTAQVGLSWQASQSLENFKASGVSVSTDQSQVRVDVASSAWLNSEVSVQENSRTLLVHDAYLESEVAQFEVGKLTGVGKDLKLEIIEKNHLPLPLQAKFKLKYMSKGHFSYWNINWNEEVPAEWIMRDGGSYWIDLGKLPIDDSLRKKGWIIGVELQATHFLGEHSKTVQIDKYGHRIGTDE